MSRQVTVRINHLTVSLEAGNLPALTFFFFFVQSSYLKLFFFLLSEMVTVFIMISTAFFGKRSSYQKKAFFCNLTNGRPYPLLIREHPRLLLHSGQSRHYSLQPFRHQNSDKFSPKQNNFCQNKIMEFVVPLRHKVLVSYWLNLMTYFFSTYGLNQGSF